MSGRVPMWFEVWITSSPSRYTCAVTFLHGLVFRAVLSQAGILIPINTYCSGNSKDSLTAVGYCIDVKNSNQKGQHLVSSQACASHPRPQPPASGSMMQLRDLARLDLAIPLWNIPNTGVLNSNSHF